MSNGNATEIVGHSDASAGCRRTPVARLHLAPLHPAWRAFLRLCDELQHGEIERVKIQDGLPVLAEVVTKKIKFNE